MRQAFAALPGVLRVSLVQVPPLSGNGNQFRAFLPGRSYRVEKGIISASQGVNVNLIGAGFFETLGIPLIAGRTFRPADFQLQANIAIVDEVFVRNFFQSENPIGRRFGFRMEQESQFRAKFGFQLFGS